MSPDEASGTNVLEEQSDPSEKADRDNRWRRWVATAAVAVLLVLLAWWLVVRVPDVVGLPQSQARLRLEAAGLHVGRLSATPDTSRPAGTVVAQNPAWLTLRFFADRVELVIAASTLGSLEGQASGAQGSGTASDTFTPPPTAKPEATSPITVPGNLSTQPVGPRVPQVVGMSKSEAMTALENAGYNVDVGKRWSSTGVPKGHVVYQSPAPLVLADHGTTVLIKISTGPPRPGQGAASGQPEQN